MPSVSVIIPARDAATTIGATLDSVVSQQPPITDIVVAVPDDDHATRRVIEAFGERVRVVDNPLGTTPAGLNLALAEARGDIIVRCDAHAVLPPGYVARAVATLTETGAANVGGIQRASGTSWLERAIAIAQTTPLGVGDARYRLGGEPGPVETVYLGSYRRDVLERLGAFDERFRRNQDYELNHRIRQAGELVWFDPELEVEYQVRPTLPALARQYFDYGSGKRLMLRSHPDSLRPRQLAAPALVLALMASAALALTPLRRWAWLAPGIYLGTIVGAGPLLALARRDLAGLATVAVLPTMHLSWGLGFLRG